MPDIPGQQEFNPMDRTDGHMNRIANGGRRHEILSYKDLRYSANSVIDFKQWYVRNQCQSRSPLRNSGEDSSRITSCDTYNSWK